MQIYTPGEISPGLFYICSPAVLLYLVKGEHSCLIDSGMTAMGPKIRQELNTHLGGVDKLDRHLLTHSHYDHLGSTTFLKRENPGLSIGAHEILAEIVQRPNAIALMQKLNETLMGGPPPADQPDMVPVETFNVDSKYADGDQIDLGGTTIEVIHTPGHTKDSVTYHCLEAGAVILGEAAGVPDFEGRIMPEFLQSYSNYMTSLDKLARLDLNLICLPHNYVLAGPEAKTYMQQSIDTSIKFKDRLLNELNETAGEIDLAFDSLFNKMFSPGGGQPKDAFSINLKAMIKTVAREFG